MIEQLYGKHVSSNLHMPLLSTAHVSAVKAIKNVSLGGACSDRQTAQREAVLAPPGHVGVDLLHYRPRRCMRRRRTSTRLRASIT